DCRLPLRVARLEQLLEALHHAPLTAPALCHGSAWGADAGLVAACDWRFAAPAPRFRMPGLRFGIVLGTRRFAALVGTDAAHEILVTSRSFGAAEAERLGFVQRLAEPAAWPEIVRGIVDARKRAGIAATRRKARTQPGMRARERAAPCDWPASPQRE